VRARWLGRFIRSRQSHFGTFRQVLVALSPALGRSSVFCLQNIESTRWSRGASRSARGRSPGSYGGAATPPYPLLVGRTCRSAVTSAAEPAQSRSRPGAVTTGGHDLTQHNARRFRSLPSGRAFNTGSFLIRSGAFSRRWRWPRTAGPARPPAPAGRSASTRLRELAVGETGARLKETGVPGV
jgi:hypothetical protein